MDQIKQQRRFMKANFEQWEDVQSDQTKGLPQPPLEKPVGSGTRLLDLPAVDKTVVQSVDLFSVIADRKSRRAYSSEAITLEELSFLLWASQGVKRVLPKQYATIRTVPSAGARHPFETYLIVNRVIDCERGVYRYCALTHQMEFLFCDNDIEERLNSAVLGQSFVSKSAVVFIWSCIPYRGEWRYHISSHKTMLLDAGHICENLYLAAEAIGCGTCAIAAYDQESIDTLIGCDGEDEFTVYLAPVGKRER